MMMDLLKFGIAESCGMMIYTMEMGGADKVVKFQSKISFIVSGYDEFKRSAFTSKG
jgi:hypothetical protein